jgi:hypothetical protein
MYQDEVDMMEIELLGRERAERLAAERAVAEASGRAEVARMQVETSISGFGWLCLLQACLQNTDMCCLRCVNIKSSG